MPIGNPPRFVFTKGELQKHAQQLIEGPFYYSPDNKNFLKITEAYLKHVIEHAGGRRVRRIKKKSLKMKKKSKSKKSRRIR